MANSHDIVGTAVWTLTSGANYGRPGYVCFQAFDGTFMLANPPGRNAAGEEGVVYVEHDGESPLGAGWQGWFQMSATGTPTPGSGVLQVFQKVGGYLGGVLVKIAPAVIQDVLVALITS